MNLRYGILRANRDESLTFDGPDLSRRSLAFSVSSRRLPTSIGIQICTLTQIDFTGKIRREKINMFNFLLLSGLTRRLDVKAASVQHL